MDATPTACAFILICTEAQARSGKPACGPRGGQAVLVAVQRRLAQLTLTGGGAAKQALGTSCQGNCFDGPNVIVAPQGVRLGGVTAADADAIVALGDGPAIGSPPPAAEEPGREL